MGLTIALNRYQSVKLFWLWLMNQKEFNITLRFCLPEMQSTSFAIFISCYINAASKDTLGRKMEGLIIHFINDYFIIFISIYVGSSIKKTIF